MNFSEKLFYIFCGLTPFEELFLKTEEISAPLKPENSTDWIVEAFLPESLTVCREDICTLQEGGVDRRNPDNLTAEVNHPVLP